MYCICGREEEGVYFFADEVKQEDADQHEGKDKQTACYRQE